MLNLSFVVDFLQITLCVKGQLGLNCPRSQSETSTFALSYDEQYIYIVLSPEVQFCNQAKIKQGTLAKLPSCERRLICVALLVKIKTRC